MGRLELFRDVNVVLVDFGRLLNAQWPCGWSVNCFPLSGGRTFHTLDVSSLVICEVIFSRLGLFREVISVLVDFGMEDF